MEMLFVRAAVPLLCTRSSQQSDGISNFERARPSPSSQSNSLAPGKVAALSSRTSSNSPLSADSQTSSPTSLTPPPESRSRFPMPPKFWWFKRVKDSPKALANDVNGEQTSSIGSITSLVLSPNEDDTRFDLTAEEKRTMHDVMSALKSSQLETLELAGMRRQSPETEGEKGGRLSKTEDEIAKSWVHNFISKRLFWNSREQKSSETRSPQYQWDDELLQSGVLEIKSEDSQRAEAIASNVEVGLGDKTTVGCVCEGCYVERLMRSKTESDKEMPHTRIAHTQESFSKFLHKVPLAELKTVSNMSFLSNLAYAIQSIKPAYLLKNHQLRFITSSVQRKVAEAKEKARLAKDAAKELACVHEIDGARVPEYSSDRSNMPKRKVPLGVVDEDSSEMKPVPELTTLREESQLRGISSEPGSQMSSAKDPVKLDLAAAAVLTESIPEPMVVAAEQTKDAIAQDLQSPNGCPCEWFVCDHELSHTRFFAIQGSESWASWQANLMFEPMPFEDPKLGVMAHSGIYEAAKGLYQQIMPLVLEHLQKHGDAAKIRFTGHSLGGSLAILVSLMLRIRETAPLQSLLPVYTFGSPYVLCGGDYLLKQLGFSQSHVQMVIMHRDIVPRSFSCDYPRQAAEVLKRFNGTFRDYACLDHQKLLYAPMGEMRILQPPSTQAPAHPFLPIGSGLYALQLPNSSRYSTSEATAWPAEAIELRSAQRAFLNKPHPLEILRDRASYGPRGGISRDHDPRSYAKGVNYLLRKELKRLRRLKREKSKHQLWHLVGTDFILEMLKGADVGNSVNTGLFGSMGAASSDMGSNDQALRSTFFTVGEGNTPSIRNSATSSSTKGRLSRSRRLKASKHVHMACL